MPAPLKQNLVATFFERAAAGGDAPFLWAKRGGAYAAWSWRRTAEAVSGLSRGMGALGGEGGGGGGVVCGFRGVTSSLRV